MKLASDSPEAKGASSGAEVREDRRVDALEVEGAEVGEDGEQAEQEGEVADAVDDERLASGLRRKILIEIEADEQIGAQADALPPDEHHQEVVPENEEQHGAHEEVQVGEIPAIARLVSHVAD